MSSTRGKQADPDEQALWEVIGVLEQVCKGFWLLLGKQGVKRLLGPVVLRAITTGLQDADARLAALRHDQPGT